jgi:iron complex outermembrane receptor protein
MGDFEKDGWNLLLNAEFGKKDKILYSDRTGFDQVGLGSIAQYPGSPFNPNSTNNNNTAAAAGVWAGSAGSTSMPRACRSTTHARSIIGNVRDRPASTTAVANTPRAQTYCNANANLPQNNPAGGCLTDLWRQVGIVQPEQTTANFFGRFSKQINANMEALRGTRLLPVEVGDPAALRSDGFGLFPA